MRAGQSDGVWHRRVPRRCEGTPVDRWLCGEPEQVMHALVLTRLLPDARTGAD